MNYKTIKNVNDLTPVFNLFENGAKLTGVTYTACSDNSNVNDLRVAELFFSGTTKFSLKFEEIDCLHVAPIFTGNISVSEVSLGIMSNRVFFADDSTFNITEPDTSLTYVIAKKLSIGK